MVSALVSRSSRLGSYLGQGHCVAFFSKPLYSHSASFHPGVEKDTGDGPDGPGGPLGSYADFNETSKSSTYFPMVYGCITQVILPTLYLLPKCSFVHSFRSIRKSALYFVTFYICLDL